MPQIRLATGQDAAAIHAIYAPIVADTTTSFETDIPTVAEMARRIQSTVKTHPWLVYMDDAQPESPRLMGYAYASSHRSRRAYQWSVDVSVYVSEHYRRRGIGRTLYAHLFHLLRKQGFYNAYAGIALPNPGSIGLHEAMGFTPIGIYHHVGYKLGAWHDVGWWEYTLQPRADEPHPPKMMEQFIQEVGPEGITLDVPEV